MDKQNEDSILCPSFNSYSSDRLAEVATKVSDEYKADHRSEAIADDDEFEFSLVLNDIPEASAEQIFHHGPVFPIFNRDIVNRDPEIKRDDDDGASTLPVPLKSLFLEERKEREPPSSSSSEADELEAIPPGTYCVWRPKVVERSPTMSKKSKSTGSVSKRFRIRDFLRRSNSEGKDSFVFLTPKNQKPESNEKVDQNVKSRRQSGDSYKVAGKSKAPPSPSSSAHELFYVQNRAMKEVDKRKSYLPYRKDLVGFFANVNVLGKSYSKSFPNV